MVPFGGGVSVNFCNFLRVEFAAGCLFSLTFCSPYCNIMHMPMINDPRRRPNATEAQRRKSRGDRKNMPFFRAKGFRGVAPTQSGFGGLGGLGGVPFASSF